MYSILKPLLFKMEPEKAHLFTIKLFRIVLAIPGGKAIIRLLYSRKDQRLERILFGLTFKNPIGLAAGFDKDGRYYKDMAHLGFGFIEIGTVTPEPQVGNEQPRLFRLPQDKALINRMGFNNEGVLAMVERLKDGKPDGVIIGGNIGKNKVTPNEAATTDYIKCFNALFPYVDYFVVNVSSPNTPGLRELQEKEPLTRLLGTLQALNIHTLRPKPILLKIAPDLTNEQLDDIVDIVKETNIAGLIATNTTIDRSGLQTDSKTVESIGRGGLSGQPLRKRSLEVTRYLARKTEGNVPIIAVGGIGSAKDALDQLRAGASLVQIYSGLIYEGPGLVKKICKEVAETRIQAEEMTW